MATFKGTQGQPGTELLYRTYRTDEPRLELHAKGSTHSTEPLAVGDGSDYHLAICSPLDTPKGLGRGYFVSGGLDAR